MSSFHSVHGEGVPLYVIHQNVWQTKQGAKKRGERDGVAREKAGIMLQIILTLCNNKLSINGAPLSYTLLFWKPTTHDIHNTRSTISLARRQER